MLIFKACLPSKLKQTQFYLLCALRWIFFLFASEELRSALTCSRDKNAFSTDAERKHISELHSDYVVPLGNKAVIKFQNKM